MSKQYIFSDIASNYVERVDPVKGDESKYVGLEHISSDTLFITTWGSEAELTGQKIKMQKGDVLFARRNAYLRRVGIAPFDGIFSAHGLVLRPNTEVIDEKLFPFFIKSDAFMDRAVKISVGSLSPTVNWKDLKKESFFIPDRKKQHEYADLFWDLENLIRLLSQRLQILDELVKSRFIEMFGTVEDSPYSVKAIKEITTVETGATPSRKNATYYGGSIPWIKTGELAQTYIYETEETITQAAINESNCKLFPENTVLFAMYGQGKTLGTSAICKISASTNQACAAIMPSDAYCPEFLLFQLKLQYNQIRMKAQGANQPNLNLSMVRNLLIICPPVNIQKTFVSFVKQVDKSKVILIRIIKSRFIEMNSKWKTKYDPTPLKNYLNRITYGFTNPMSDSDEGPWKITAKDVVNGQIDYTTARKTTLEEYDNLTDKSKPKKNDVLLTKDGTLGRTALVLEEGLCVNQSVAVLTPNSSIVPSFLSILLQMPEYQTEMIKNSGGGTIKHIYITKVEKMMVCVPLKEEQEAFVAFIEQVDKSKVAFVVLLVVTPL
jgi:type I restriction enzyme S subunit